MPYRLNGNCVQENKAGEWSDLKCHSSKEQALAHLRALEINVEDVHKGLEPMTDTQLSNFNIFIPLVKVDYNKRQVYGRMTQEIPDGGREIMDYASSKPNFEKWSAAAKARTSLLPEDQQSLGNLRAMHQPISAGKVIDIQYKDAEKAIDIGTYVADDDSWNKVLSGVFTGFSVGGSYAKRWMDAQNPALTRYTALPVEVSLVDSPAVSTATFTMIKADGTAELHKLGEPFASGPFEDLNDASDPVENPTNPALIIIDSTDGPVKEIPTIADHFVSPNLIDNDATPANIPTNNPAAPDVVQIEVLKAFTAAVNELSAFKKADNEEKLQHEAKLKALGSRVGIARRESEPLVAKSEHSTTSDEYGDPANWAWPLDNPARCQTAIVGFNKGQGRDKYSDREWHVLGRRIANRASEQFGTRHQYRPVSKQITSEVLRKMEMNKDMAGLMAQLKAGIDVAVDQIGKDPAAAKDILMSLLGHLDNSDNSKGVNAANPANPPNGGGQGDGVGKAADVVEKDQLPPIAAEAKAKAKDKSEDESEKMSSDVEKALTAKVDGLAAKFEKLMAKLDEKPVTTPEPAPAIAKNAPAGDLAALLPPPAPAINPVIVALLSGDKNALQKAAVLAGSAERPDTEAVMKMAQEFAAASLKPEFTNMMIANGLANIPSFNTPVAQ